MTRREEVPDPHRDAERSDEQTREAREAEQARVTDEDGNHAERVDEPAERGASEDDAGPDDVPDQDLVRSRIAEAAGLSPEEMDDRFARERGLSTELPAYSHREAFETGFAGQVPDPTPNEAYTVSGQVTGEAAAQDRAAASRGRLDDRDLQALRERFERFAGRVGSDE